MSTSRSILIILAHPDLGSSRVNAALVSAIEGAEGVQIRHLTELYPTNVIDIPAEQHALSNADEIVLQYPTYWYSAPGIMKQWLDEVLTRGWAYGTGKPGALAGKRLRVVTTTGGTQDAYATDGSHGWDFNDILIPLQATARRLGMLWDEPLVIHGVRDITDPQLADHGKRYEAQLLEGKSPAQAA
ncbi:NAD(P)H-dependent oxidoreductase [Arthrobacter sp. NPDC058127]|uniref:NAD(P)H-dependent oxidoreductase n=1 Tax=Arthrobacter sp. NPDC058127 TaxID=3346351 RepID=UPI0036E194B8